MPQGEVFKSQTLQSTQLYEEYLKAASSSNQPNWPGCEGWMKRRRRRERRRKRRRRRREARFSPNPAFHGREAEKTGRGTVFPQQSRNNEGLKTRTYFSSLWLLPPDTSHDKSSDASKDYQTITCNNLFSDSSIICFSLNVEQHPRNGCCPLFSGGVKVPQRLSPRAWKTYCH